MTAPGDAEAEAARVLLCRLTMYQTVIIPAHTHPAGDEHVAMLGVLCTRCPGDGALLIVGSGVLEGGRIDQADLSVADWADLALSHEREEHPHGPYLTGENCGRCGGPMQCYATLTTCPACDTAVPA